jgi:hypothetical protein
MAYEKNVFVQLSRDHFARSRLELLVEPVPKNSPERNSLKVHSASVA